MLPPTRLLRACVAATMLAATVVAVEASATGPATGEPASTVTARTTDPATDPAARKPKKAKKDPRRTQGLFVDDLMPAYQAGGVYRKRIGKRPQAFWVIPEMYGTSDVRGIVRAYTGRAVRAHKTPMVVVYGIPGRDCGQYSSGNPLTTAATYRAWINQVARGLKRQKALVVLEPDALPFFSSSVDCPTKPDGWQKMLRYASKRLSKSGAWVYLDAGHSNWTPYDTRPKVLKASGIRYARGFSTNVSNFRTTGAEKSYAKKLLSGLRKIGVKGKHYVIDTSRNGVAPQDGQVINPPWARVGTKPRLVFRGAFDGTLWVKHPGESDGFECGGPESGRWSPPLADRLLGRDRDNGC